jgi:putative ABC transport system permease protein
MKTLIKMAFRNIFRFKRRTFITFSASSFGLALLIVSITLMNGIDKQSLSNIINCQTSHLKVFKKGYFDEREKLPMDKTISNPGRIHELLKDIPGIKAGESRILFGAGLIKGMDELPCLGVAIQPEVDPDLFTIKESMVQGQWLEPGESKMLVGIDLAEDTGIKVGDIVTVRLVTSSQEEDFSWNAVDFEVKGIYDSGNPAVDRARIIVPMAAAVDGLGMETEVTEIVIRLDSDSDNLISTVQKKVQEKLSAANEDLEVYTWKDLAGVFLAISKVKTKRSSFIIMIMLLIASMGIINTMLMAVMERTREIGMMTAMGMNKAEIKWLFIFEGGFIGVIGSLLGCVLGGLASWYLEVYGWSMDFMGETMKEVSAAFYPVKDVFYADLSVGVLVMTFVLGTIISMVASYYPARKAAKLDPIDALRHI